VLVVTAGSQGAQTINAMMRQLADNRLFRELLADWQILHLAGSAEAAQVQSTYDQVGLAAKVMPYLQQMGLAWAAASLAISRAGASTVGEVWASHVPTVFMPYPYHKDQHQRDNARPLVRAGGALMGRDHIDAAANAQALAEQLTPLLQQPDRLTQMAQNLRDSAPPDGAAVVAHWLDRMTL
jgi:UDP-N-acetylglucosamine--N-acetylmuramyl-(pentapeptide) pyrophosphoryl-undecaprenol N-acetylglucosamine transferase